VPDREAKINFKTEERGKNTTEVQRGQNSEWQNSASFIFDDSSDTSLPGLERRKSIQFPHLHVPCILHLSSISQEKRTHLNDQ